MSGLEGKRWTNFHAFWDQHFLDQRQVSVESLCEALGRVLLSPIYKIPINWSSRNRRRVQFAVAIASAVVRFVADPLHPTLVVQVVVRADIGGRT